ncbi:MAG: S53 family peptidase [Legionella sp.]|nr:S53 family peptidase [Legionella sp.]
MLINHWSSKVVLVCLPLLIVPAAFAAPQTTDTSLVSLPNLELSTLKQAHLLGAMEPQKEITFTVWLKLRNKKQLNQLINDLYDPQSPQYQKFLPDEEVNSQYSPSSESLESVQNYFIANGMQAEIIYSNVQVTATVQQIEQLFATKINYYSYKNTIVYGNATAPVLPAAVAQKLSGISGLSSIPYAKPLYHNLKQSALHNSTWKPERLDFKWDSFVPTAVPTTTSLQGISGAQLRTAYKVASIPPVNGKVIDGAGQTIVILDSCGLLSTAQLTTYANKYNTANSLPQLTTSNFAVVKSNGTPYSGGCPDTSGEWDGEILLDIQAAHTIAPASKIVVVLTTTDFSSQVASTINYITSHNFTIAGFSNAYVMSNSWGYVGNESATEPLDTTLATAAAKGFSINFSTGDCGDQTYNSDGCSKIAASPTVAYPATSGYVTAVGGTSLFVDTNWNYAFETGWGSQVNGTFDTGSGGGISKYRPLPTWQKSITALKASGYNAGTVGQYNKRALPDIGMLADMYTGLLIYTPDCNPCYFGGTSLASPLFTGTLALINQSRSLLANGAQKPIGLAAPYLYTYNLVLNQVKAFNPISPPHQIISGAQPINGQIYAFKILDSFFNQTITFNWDSSLATTQSQFWNDVSGVGSPNIPNFVKKMSTL